MPETFPDDTTQEIVVYVGPGVEISLPLDRDRETVWASQAQIAELFGVDRSRVTRHVNSIFRDEEVGQESNVRKAHIASSDRPVTYYSLDVILAVGYRANSDRAIQFRRWANDVLKDYIVAGVAINNKRLDDLGSIVRLLSRADDELVSGVADVLAGYIPGLQLLRDYDDGRIAIPLAPHRGGNSPSRKLGPSSGASAPHSRRTNSSAMTPRASSMAPSVPSTRASVVKTSTRA